MKDAIVVVGSLNADLVARVPRFPAPGETVPGTDFAIYPGGKGANQACAAGRLGGRVHMVGRVGEDANGRLLTQSLSEAGVDTAAVIPDATVPTGTALITIDDSGQNEIVVVPGANGAVTPEDVERQKSLFESACYVLLQLEIPHEAVEAAARLGRETGAQVILDPAPARAEAWSLLPLVDYVTPNETELDYLVNLGHAPAADPPARRLLLGGARNVVSKLGAEGARLLNEDGEISWTGHAVEAVDTTAAGDVWNGAFAAALASGMELEAAGGFANEAAALSVTRPGAQPSMPTRAELIAFVKGGQK
jgi:ribokinase